MQFTYGNTVHLVIEMRWNQCKRSGHLFYVEWIFDTTSANPIWFYSQTQPDSTSYESILFILWIIEFIQVNIGYYVLN